MWRRRGHFCVVLAAMAIVCAGIGRATAEPYPNRPITLVVGFTPGGFIDILARMIGHKLSERTGHPVVVETRAGAGGNIAHRAVASAEPDGYTLLAATTSLAINETLYKNRGYTADDFVTVAIPVSSPEVLANHPGRLERNLREVVEGAKARPVNFGTAGAGSGSYIAAEYFFRKLAKVPATHVPFQGGAPAITAGVANQIDVVAVAMAGGAVAPIRSGRLRGLGVASEKRVPSLPDVPTYKEAGFPPFVATAWAGFFAPAKTDPEIVFKLNALIDDIMNEPDVVSKLQHMGFDPIHTPQSQADKFFRSEVDKWGQMVTTLGISIN